MSLILLQNVTVNLERQTILRDVYFRLSAGERVGLIGKNGAGKTTLLRLILGQVIPQEGQVTVATGVRIGYFSQFSELSGDRSVRQALEDLFPEVHALEDELRRVELKLGTATSDTEQAALLDRHATLSAELEQRGGWTYQTEIETVLSKLGFTAAQRERPVDQLSGGWRNRASLARLLIERPDVLLLDEPTNYLDVEGVSWLESWLSRHQGAAIVVSHDRHFLDRVSTRIAEVEHHHLQEYEGGYTEYVRQKPMRLTRLERVFEHEQELLIMESEAIVRRREDARSPGDALRRRLANVKKQVEPRPVDVIVTQLYGLLRVPDRLCRVEDVAKEYDDHALFSGLSFEMARGDRLAIMGPNGCGKSTLLRLLAGQEHPDTGRVVWEHGVQGVSFNRLLDELPLDDTVTHAVNQSPLVLRAPRRQVNRFLSLMRFSEAELQQRIGTLSGGLKARVALAQCLLSGAPVLLLDEPTNHLDVTTIQVFERALSHFPGAVIVVSHDRFFVDQVASRLLVFEDGRVRLVEGTWTMWQSLRGVQSAV